jgi:hypothetical protein
MTAYGVLVIAVGTGDRLNLNWADVVLHAGPPWWPGAASTHHPGHSHAASVS